MTNNKDESVKIKQHLGLLGLRVRDRVTDFVGVVVTISFDLFGCIQALVHPSKGADGKMKDQHWFNVSRLLVLSEKPVMSPPDFEDGKQADGLQGAADKPLTGKA